MRSRVLWWLAAAAAAPLLGLLALQYHWMRQLERTSAIVQEATLENYLEALTADIEVFYRTEGERALNLAPGLFTNGPETLSKAPYYFKKKGWVSARRLFVVPLVGENAGAVFYYDAATAALIEPPADAEARAVYVAVAPWKMLAMKAPKLETPTLAVDERDPEHRVLFNPITDEASRLVGLAGMILDRQHFEAKVLPAAVKKSLPGFFPEGHGKAPVVTARDGRGRAICFGADRAPGEDDVRKRLGFAFTDYEIGLRSRHETPASWARRNFKLNLALSGLLAALVVGGVGFALRAAAREMKLSAMKSEFVSNVSHELRTPLASIRVFGELLRLGKIESVDKSREYGEYIETESRRLTQLVNNILDFSRIESGRREYRFESSDLAAVVAETLRTFRPSLEQAGFRLEFAPPSGSARLPAVVIDAAAIAQAVGNLLDNAVKYSNGARDIEVGVRRDGEWAVVWVRDRGVGIARQEQAKIFDRFHRVSTGLVHDVKGSGLGLAIVRHIVEAHQGRAEVDSQPGQGSTFSLYLPCPTS